jgi:hypothetical protein
MRYWSGISVLIITGFLALSGCSSAEYLYQPEEHQSSQFGTGKNEAVYSEPTNQPKGKVRVASMGLVDIKSKQDSKKFSALRLRISITNQSTSESWTFNTRDQSVSFPNDGQAKPLMMDPSESSVVTVGPGELKTLDYYFPLPNEKMSADNLPQFDFHWQLEAGANHVQETTSFNRIEIQERYASAYYGPTYPYYYDPWFYPGPYWGPGWHGGGFVVIRRR